MHRYRLIIGVVESITTKKYVEVEADSLEEAENLAVTLEGSTVTEKLVGSEITDIELLGEWNNG